MPRGASLCPCLTPQRSQSMMQLQRACSAAGILEASGALQLSAAIGEQLSLVRGGSTVNLCLRCGKPGATRLCGNGCSVARFCGPECETAALFSHRGACTKAREVRARLQSGPAVTEAEVDELQSLVSLVGRYLHPLSPSSERSEKVLRFLHHHPEVIQQRLADHLFLSCIDLHRDRLCCNPHIYTWCLVEGCLKADGDVTRFARSIGLVSESSADSPLAAEQARQRYEGHAEFMDWQRTTVLPLQEMLGQVGTGRFWEKNPASLNPSSCCTLDPTSPCPTARRSMDVQRLNRRIIADRRDSASSFPPSRGSPFAGVPSILAARSDEDTSALLAANHSRSAAVAAPAACRPPMSRSSSVQPDGLA